MTQGCQSSRGRTARGFTQENSSPIRTALVQMARSDRLRWRLEADLRTASRRAWAMPAGSALLRTTCWRAGSGSARSSYRCALRSARDRRQQGPDCQNLIEPLGSNCIQEGQPFKCRGFLGFLAAEVPDKAEQTETATAQRPAQSAQFETEGPRGFGPRSRAAHIGAVKRWAARKPA